MKPEWLCYAKLIGELPPPQYPPTSPRRRSELCKQADFSLDAYRYWSSAVGLAPNPASEALGVLLSLPSAL